MRCAAWLAKKTRAVDGSISSSGEGSRSRSGSYQPVGAADTVARVSMGRV
jgi:hypothetical protein